MAQLQSDTVSHLDGFDTGDRYLDFEGKCRWLFQKNDLVGFASLMEGDDWKSYPTGQLYKTISLSIQNQSSSFQDEISLPSFSEDYMPGYLYGVKVFGVLCSTAFQKRFEGARLSKDVAIETVKQLGFTPRLYFSLSCNKKYFDYFGPDLIASFAQGCADGVALNIHIDCAKDELSGVLEVCNQDWISLSWSDLGYEKSAVHTITRFIAASRLLERYGCDVIVTDFDSYFVDGFGAASLSLAEACDRTVVCGRPTNPPSLPWQKYLASFQLFPKGEHARDLLNDFERIWLLLAEEGRGVDWYVDQNILAYLYDHLGYRIVGQGNYAYDIIQGVGTPAIKKSMRVI